MPFGGTWRIVRLSAKVGLLLVLLPVGYSLGTSGGQQPRSVPDTIADVLMAPGFIPADKLAGIHGTWFPVLFAVLDWGAWSAFVFGVLLFHRYWSKSAKALQGKQPGQ